MWGRISEIILGLWLIVSFAFFSYYPISAMVAGAFMIIFASLSYLEKLNKMHLFQVFPAAWLLYLGYGYPTPWLPTGLQNCVIVALLLLMFTIVPSHASDHPRPWKKFLDEKKD